MKKSEAFQILGQKIATCIKCTELTEYRQENNYLTAPGIGNPNARIMVVGEAPGEEEAKQGVPFVGKAGKLLTKILEACGWMRDDIYIANILKCRPPGNREPTSGEAANCRPFLDLQIKLVDPQWILCFGRTASIYLLGADPDSSMGSFRGRIHEYQGRKVLCTYHPSFLSSGGEKTSTTLVADPPNDASVASRVEGQPFRVEDESRLNRTTSYLRRMTPISIFPPQSSSRFARKSLARRTGTMPPDTSLPLHRETAPHRIVPCQPPCEDSRLVVSSHPDRHARSPTRCRSLLCVIIQWSCLPP